VGAAGWLDGLVDSRVVSALILSLVVSSAPVYALVVANNASNDAKQAPLQFADDDGARYHSVFAPRATEVRLLTVLDDDTQRRFPGLAAQTRPPTRAELLRAFEELNTRMRADRARGERPVFFFVFTGHGKRGAEGEGAISLLGHQFTRAELFREVLEPLEAHTAHLIIDACDSYFFVNQRGALPTAPAQAVAVTQFLSERSLERFPHVGVVLSTSSQQESHEWAAIRAGVFSHEVVSALLGAADVNADGRVEYSELKAFVAAANLEVKDPRGQVHLFARAPASDRAAPLADLSAPSRYGFLLLPAATSGRLWLEDERGVRHIELHKEAGRPVLLALPPRGRFFVHAAGREARLDNREGALVDAARLGWTTAALAPRGSLDEAFREHLFERPFGARFYEGFVASSGELAVAPAVEPDLTP
jgi:hypothetical protein